MEQTPAGVVHGGIFNITVVGSNYNLTQGSDGIPHYYGNNASYALNYVVSRGEAVYLGEGNYSDNGAVISYLSFADGALICAEPGCIVYIKCEEYRIESGSATIIDVILKR